ncbi:BspA family leucine-rich repeat surface protein [Flagellimonas onchidii]|uniref:BspA family leucine-rich repeat surface protein n=1 Tax=Flagellimonas onchidii TaxID=2562684 RepID=UPI003AAD099E
MTLGISTNFEALYEITDAGVLSLASGKNLDSKTSHTITVTAFDGALSGDGKITININNVNKAPEIAADQVFEVDENVEGPVEIGEVVATDEDGDALAFDIEYAETDDELFTIDEVTGALSLAEGVSLDYEGTPTHKITVSVSDGTADTVMEEVTINVINDTSLYDDPNSFVTTWTTDGPEVEIQLNVGIADADLEGLTFDYMIDWGDGSEVEELTTSKPIHIYEEPGTYTVAIQGQFPAFRALGYEDYFTSMEQWGNIQWQYLEGAFTVCDGMEYNAQDNPDLSLVKDLNVMFGGSQQQSIAMAFNGSISDWNTENVERIAFMFSNNTTFNQDISGWKVSNVTDMFGMFDGATAFDQNLGSWNISSVTNMTDMLNNSGMSPQNYGATLIGWANLPIDSIPEDITLGSEGMAICLEDLNNGLTPALDILDNQKNWEFPGVNAVPIICGN